MIQDTQEFAKFKKANINTWGSISQLISQLEKFIQQYNIKYTQISSNALLQFASLDQETYSRDDLITLITN